MLRRGPLAGQWYDLSLAAGALASIEAASEALKLIQSHGGFAVNSAAPYFSTVKGMTDNLWVKVQSALTLFGANFFGLSHAQAVVPLLHLIAVALVACGAARAVRRFFADDDLAMQVLTASFVVLLAAFTFGDRTGAREAAGLLPIGAALAGRMLAPSVFRFRLEAAFAAVLAAYGLTLAAQLVSPAHPGPDRSLASWLQARHLTYGLSTTWLASSGITIFSQDHVQVRDVEIAANGMLARLAWNTETSWYNPRQHDARFLILNPCSPPPIRPLFEALGPPAATYYVDDFPVLVWNSNLLTPRRPPSAARARAGVIRPHSPVKSGDYQLACG